MKPVERLALHGTKSIMKSCPQVSKEWNVIHLVRTIQKSMTCKAVQWILISKAFVSKKAKNMDEWLIK